MRKVIVTWSVLTLLLTAACYLYLDTLPPDEFVLANSAGFRLIVALAFVGGSAVILLFVALFFGAIIRSVRQSK